MDSSEFSAFLFINRTLKLWWLVFLAALVGGALGFVFFYLHPPVYEATATYFVTLDLDRFPMQGLKPELIQYNEDMAVNTTEGALISDKVIKEVLSQVQSAGISLSYADLIQNYTIERKHDLWELRYRSHTPPEAQMVVNTWAQIGYQEMLVWQASGLAPAYVIFQPPSQALIPTQPVLYGRNNLMLAGALIGFIVGIILSYRFGRLPLKIS